MPAPLTHSPSVRNYLLRFRQICETFWNERRERLDQQIEHVANLAERQELPDAEIREGALKVASRLQELAARPHLPAWIRPFIQALQAIVAGSRNRTLADAAGLNYAMAAEILFLLETLEKPR